MAGICSRHRTYQADCKACNATPADVLGVSQQNWDAHVVEAQSEGTIRCAHCGFTMYRKTCRLGCGEYLCPRCVEVFKGET